MNKVVAWRYKQNGYDWSHWRCDAHNNKFLPANFDVELAYAIPDTHCVVPREPTEVMIDAGIDRYHDDSGEQPGPAFIGAWKAMLNAAEVGDE